MIPFSRTPTKSALKTALNSGPDIVMRDRFNALRLLTLRDPAAAVLPLGQILGREGEASDLRVAAATLLARTPRARAQTVLLRNLQTGDPQVRYRIVKSLGKIGGRAALKRLDRMPGARSAAEAKQLALAKSLIAYRNNMDRDDIEFVEGVRRRPGAPEQMLELRLRRMRARKRIAPVIESVERDPFGIELARTRAFEVDIGRAHWTILLNRKAARHRLLASIAERRWLLALMALRAPAKGVHSVQYLVLTRPARGETQILVLRTDGEMVYSGRAELTAKALAFRILDVRRQGTAPTRVEGRLTASGFGLDMVIPYRMRKDKRRAETQSVSSLEEMRRRFAEETRE